MALRSERELNSWIKRAPCTCYCRAIEAKLPKSRQQVTQARPREKLCWHTRSRQAPSPSFNQQTGERSFGSALEPPVKVIHLSLSCQASTLLHCLTSEAPSCVRFCCGPSPRIFPESVCMATKERHHYSGLACTELIGTALLAVLLVIVGIS